MLISTDTYQLSYDYITNTSTGDSYVYIKHIYVEYPYRNKGIGRTAISELHQKYNTYILLECFETLISFYEHIGFYIYELCEDDYYLMRRDI